MPIFEYKCNKCEEVKDRLVSRADADADAEFDCECGQEDAKLQRTAAPTAAGIRFRGRWPGTTGL